MKKTKLILDPLKAEMPKSALLEDVKSFYEALEKGNCETLYFNDSKR